jgi:ABC-type multidrug transport system fused ATPase/permease subunit
MAVVYIPNVPAQDCGFHPRPAEKDRLSRRARLAKAHSMFATSGAMYLSDKMRKQRMRDQRRRITIGVHSQSSMLYLNMLLTCFKDLYPWGRRCDASTTLLFVTLCATWDLKKSVSLRKAKIVLFETFLFTFTWTRKACYSFVGIFSKSRILARRQSIHSVEQLLVRYRDKHPSNIVTDITRHFGNQTSFDFLFAYYKGTQNSRVMVVGVIVIFATVMPSMLANTVLLHRTLSSGSKSMACLFSMQSVHTP